jgi:alpha-tubulin suppressor-like RCC1 family protein
LCVSRCCLHGRRCTRWGSISSCVGPSAPTSLCDWGYSAFGELGYPTSNIAQNAPGELTIAPRVDPVAAVATIFDAWAIGSNGNLYGWGGDGYGGVGGGNISNAPVAPEVITLAPGVQPSAIAAGGEALAIGNDGNLYAWGGLIDQNNASLSTNVSEVPEAIALPPGVHPTAIAVGTNTAFAIGSDGNLYAWGD